VIYTCCDENRRAAVRGHASLNGIDWLEVLDSDAPTSRLRQRVLLVRMLNVLRPAAWNDTEPENSDHWTEWAAKNVVIAGGTRERDLRVDWVARASTLADGDNGLTHDEWKVLSGLAEREKVLLVCTDRPGDFSRYHLTLVRAAEDHRPPRNFDPRLVNLDLFFRVECPSDFDCKPATVCRDEVGSAPDIDYLVKDYPGFRRVMLDRLSRLVPGWRERSAADLGVVLAELLAYVADHLSYWQDAVATEAYLETARRRTSLRRHALLVDYAMHDGCNARAWVRVRVNGSAVPLVNGRVRLYTKVPGVPDRVIPGSRDEQRLLQAAPLVFEPMHDAVLFDAHNEMTFYTWGDNRCCLPRGATAATLRDFSDPALRLRLRPGDVLIFQEQKGPLSGEPEDANPLRRHAVRLTRVFPEADEIDRTPGPLVLDPLTAGTESEQAVVEIEWDRADALPFPLCLSSQTDDKHGHALIEDVSVALGNVVLADHGLTIRGEKLGPVPQPALYYPPERDVLRCDSRERVPVQPRFRPRLAEGPLTRIGQVLRSPTVELVSFNSKAPASAAMAWEMSRVVPAIRLDLEGEGGESWTPRGNLLDSQPTDAHFVVETEYDGTSSLRFGDAVHGKRPVGDTVFTASYRVGNGSAGNVGAGAIAHVVTDDERVVAVANPLAAQGGAESESMEQVRRRAPQAFRTQERAVTPADYAEVTERLAGVQRAAASLRWTGSWHTVFVTVDRVGGVGSDPDYRESVLGHLERYRMTGHDLRVADPRYASLEIELLVCVAPDFFRSDVRKGLLEVLGSGTLDGGRRGLFHPDNFSFGQTVYLSPVYAAARGVAGVASVQVNKFQRLGQDDPGALAAGFLPLGQLEIARLDNDPNYPEHGVLRLDLHGGK
jgi:hypothetical protein